MARANILVVDDEPVILEIFTHCFGGKGFQVETASDAYQALAKAGMASYDLVFLDIKMPGMNGVEALGDLKRMQPRAKFMLMTGFWDDTSYLREKAEKVGIFKLIEKPFEMSDILLLAEEALASSRK